MQSSRNRYLFVVLILLLPLLFVLDLFFGSINIPFEQVLDILGGDAKQDSNSIIVLQSRLPKAITAVLCGTALAVSGLLMQSLFQNPLAGPYILGISSGSGLAVAIVIMGASIFGISLTSVVALPIAAMIGAISILILLFILSFKVRDIMTLLILGVMVGAIATAFIGIIQFFTSDYQLKSYLIWTLGSLESVDYQDLKVMAMIISISSLVIYLFSKSLNTLLLGESYAKSIGVSIVKTRLIVILVSGTLTGIVTAYCGPIGFIGIVIPHLARLMFQTTSHQVLIPACILMGASTLLFSDLISNLPSDGIRLPINSITAILGIPAILWIILNKRTISSGF